MINKYKTFLYNGLPILLLLLIPEMAFAQGWVDKALNSNFANWLRNLDPHLQAVWVLIHATAYIMGIWFLVISLFKFKKYGEQRTMMSTHHSIVGPLVVFTISVCLFYLPSMLDTMIATLWTGETTQSVLAQPLPAGTEFQSILNTLFNLLRVIGAVTFVRGLVMLSRAGQENSQPGIVGKGLLHLFTGIMGVNITGVINVIQATLT